MNTEADEFNRIEREAAMRKEAVRATVADHGKRWDYINNRAITMSTSKYESLCYLLHIDFNEDRFDLGEAIDKAIKEQP